MKSHPDRCKNYLSLISRIISYQVLGFSPATAAADSPTAQLWASILYTKLRLPKLTLIPADSPRPNEGNKIPFTLPNAAPLFFLAGRLVSETFDPKKSKKKKERKKCPG